MPYNPYCKHGVYVGGCGIDWMCGACEMGDPDLTINQMLGFHADAARDLEDMAAWVEHLLLSKTGTLTAIEIVTRDLTRPIARQMHAYDHTIAKAERFASGPDDDDWLSKAWEFYTYADDGELV